MEQIYEFVVSRKKYLRAERRDAMSLGGEPDGLELAKEEKRIHADIFLCFLLIGWLREASQQDVHQIANQQ